jgi:hypothetical protein
MPHRSSASKEKAMALSLHTATRPLEAFNAFIGGDLVSMDQTYPLTWRAAFAVAAAGLATACSGQPFGADEDLGSSREAVVADMHRHGIHPKIDHVIHNQSAPAGAHLTYNGGRVNSNAQVIQVLWGTGSYESHITSTATPSMATFYQQVLNNGSYSSWLNGEYNTVSNSYNGTKTNQNIGTGAFVSQVTITPSTTATTVDDTTIQSELTAQISAGHLPTPTHDAAGNGTTYYAVFFPHGVTITQGGSSSCVSGGFCAYHGTVGAAGSPGEYYYGVHPDMQSGSGCDTGCGSASTAFGNYTSVASHELTEMITDAEVGVAGNGSGPPLAWYDNTNGEIGDICNAQQGTYTACDGQSYTIQLEFSNAQNNCIGFPASSCGVSTPDFTISAGTASVADGASGSASVSTTAVGGSGTVSLSLSGVPTGVTATLATSSVTAGSGTSVNIAVGASVAPGSYGITVNGTESNKSHQATIPLNVTAGGGGGGGGAIVNGDFETGNLSGWTSTGTTANVSSGCHGGSHCAQLGGTGPTNGDSSIAQTFTAPTGATGIALWYKVTCPDTVTYDWATVTLVDNTASGTATLLAKTCTAAGAWTQVTGSLIAGHSYTLTLTSHDDDYASDPTYTLYDDVTITGGGGGGGGGGTLTDGGFESGTTGWTTAGTTSIATSGCHGGSKCAQAGGTGPTNGDSSFSQTFTAGSGNTKLTFWYKVTCPDTVTYDWATATLKDNTASTTTTVLAHTCTAAGAWTQVSASVTGGHSYTLTLTSHDDNYAGDPTYTLFDDVALQ